MKSYLSLIEDVARHGESHKDRTGVGTLSVFGRQWRHDMRTGFPLLTTKFVPLRVVFEELAWFLRGSTNRNELQARNVKIWDEWSAPTPDFEGDMGPVYGAQWRNFGGEDQIANLIDGIMANPNSRRLIVSAWNPPFIEDMALPPCHYAFQVKCFEDKSMSLKMSMRSADLFLGVPFNIASYALLLKMIAHVCDYTARELVVDFGDLHIYTNHTDAVIEQRSREPKALPTVEIRESFVPVGSTPMDRLLNMTWENISLSDYDHHPRIKAPVAV